MIRGTCTDLACLQTEVKYIVSNGTIYKQSSVVEFEFLSVLNQCEIFKAHVYKCHSMQAIVVRIIPIIKCQCIIF
jgi:hypothetical protein